jgi:hypothetical protein
MATNDGSTIGALAVPLLPPASKSDTVADPALDIVLAFIRAMFNTYAAAAWKSVAPGEPIVRCAFIHDPEEYDFSEGDLPALYLFRTGSAKNSEQVAEDIRVQTDTLQLFWVLPRCEPSQERIRAPIFGALGKLIGLKIDRSRDPAFVLASDPDPTKTAQGTVVLRAAGLNWISFLQWQKTTLAIQMGEGMQRRAYQALSVKLQFEEQIDNRFDDLSNPTGVDFTAAVAGAVDSNGNPLPVVPFSKFIGS